MTRKLAEYKYGPRSVAIGHFNNDTFLDMVITNHIVNKIAVYLGNGDGTFTNSITYSTGSYSSPYMAIIADFNNDSRLDIAVANFGTNSIGIFHGFGNGSFAKQMDISTGSSRPIAIIAADFNNDSILGRSMGSLPLFWKVFFFSIFFRSICRYGPENTFGEKKLGPSYKKFRDRGHFLGTCLIL